MRVSDQGIELLKSFEGVVPYEYLDQVGYPTISKGIRTDLLKADKLDKYTNVVNASEVAPIKVGGKFIKVNVVKGQVRVVKKELEYDFIRETMRVYEDGINSLITAKVSQSQFDVLVSLAYNIGLGNLRKSPVLAQVNGGKDPVGWLNHNRAKGQVLPSLDKRRKKEYEIFKTSPY